MAISLFKKFVFSCRQRGRDFEFVFSLLCDINIIRHKSIVNDKIVSDRGLKERLLVAKNNFVANSFAMGSIPLHILSLILLLLFPKIF